MTDNGAEAARALADRVASAYFEASPLMATYMGLPGYDDKLPDLSEDAHEKFRTTLRDLYLEAVALDTGDDAEAAVIVAAARDRVVGELGALDASPYDLAVSPLPLVDGPAMLQFMLSQAVVADDEAADGYLTRCHGIPRYLEQLADRYRAAAARGQLPVGALVEQTIAQVGQLAATPEVAVGLTPGKGTDEWREQVAAVAREVVQPALERYQDVLRELAQNARPTDRPGLVWVPGGAAAYQMAVKVGTTLSVDPAEVHRIGLEELARVEEQILAVGSRAFGVSTLAEVLERMRSAPPVVEGTDALLAHVVSVIRRAEEVAVPVLPQPPAPPCDVEPMSDAVGDAGVPPMYRPPSRTGGRAGAYMMNTRRPGPAAAAMLETVTFHETVPGHHTQFALLQQLPDLPLLLSSFNVVPHGEGWGLYAELLADELDLYSDDVQRLGMLVSHAWRAVRLVVDTGLHWFGWTRERALSFALERTGMPEQFMAAEIDRYIAVPGQALGYLMGLREILSLRSRAQRHLGGEFDLRRFHMALLSHGSLPLPTLRLVVENELGLSPDRSSAASH